MRRLLLSWVSPVQRAPASHGSSLRALLAWVSRGKGAPAHEAPSPTTTRQNARGCLFGCGVTRVGGAAISRVTSVRATGRSHRRAHRLRYLVAYRRQAPQKIDDVVDRR